MRVVSLGVATLLAVVLSGCGGSEEESPPACAAVPGQATVATGGSTITNYTLNLGSGTIRFTNDNGSFYTGTVDTEIANVGPVCLADVVSWPGGGVNLGYVPAVVGDAYVVQFTTRPGGVTTIKYAKFVVRSYSAGVVTVTYVPSL